MINEKQFNRCIGCRYKTYNPRMKTQPYCKYFDIPIENVTECRVRREGE